MSVGRICSRVMVTAGPYESVRAAAVRMADSEVGTLVVTEANGAEVAIGIVTDRDIVVRCVAANLDPDSTPVSRVMTTPVQTVDEDAPVEDAVAKMAATGSRRLIVTGKAQGAVGILSLDDVLELLGEETAAITRLLEKQMPHIPA
jgi:signal-transduction protein with cAMP-binding, CBS, and nucleotidyltransferase domain